MFVSVAYNARLVDIFCLVSVLSIIEIMCYDTKMALVGTAGCFNAPHQLQPVNPLQVCQK